VLQLLFSVRRSLCNYRNRVSHYPDGHIEVQIGFLTQNLNPGDKKTFGGLTVTYTRDGHLVLASWVLGGITLLDIDISQIQGGSIFLKMNEGRLEYAGVTVYFRDGSTIVASTWKGTAFLWIAQSFTNSDGSIKEVCVNKKDATGKDDKVCAGTDGSGNKGEVCKRLCEMLDAANKNGDTAGASAIQKMRDALKCPACVEDPPHEKPQGESEVPQ